MGWNALKAFEGKVSRPWPDLIPTTPCSVKCGGPHINFLTLMYTILHEFIVTTVRSFAAIPMT